MINRFPIARRIGSTMFEVYRSASSFSRNSFPSFSVSSLRTISPRPRRLHEIITCRHIPDFSASPSIPTRDSPYTHTGAPNCTVVRGVARSRHISSLSPMEPTWTCWPVSIFRDGNSIIRRYSNHIKIKCSSLSTNATWRCKKNVFTKIGAFFRLLGQWKWVFFSRSQNSLGNLTNQFL